MGKLMASDVIESEAAVRADMSLNNSTANYVPPKRTHDELGHRHGSSPSSSGVSGEGDEEETDDFQHRTAPELEPCEEAQEIRTSGTPQQRTAADNEQEPTGRRSSTPTSLQQPAPVGRSVRVMIVFLSQKYSG